MYINIIHHKKIHPKIPSTTLVLKYIFKISNSMMGIILSQSQIYFIHLNFLMFVENFKIIDYIKSKVNQIYLKQTRRIQDVMHYKKKLIIERLYLWLQFWKGLSVVSPNCKNCQTNDVIGIWLCLSIMHIQWKLPCIGYSKSSSNWNCEQGPMLLIKRQTTMALNSWWLVILGAKNNNALFMV